MNVHLLNAVKKLLDSQGADVLDDPRRVDAALPVFAGREAATERKAFVLCVSSGVAGKLKKQKDAPARLELKKRLARDIVAAQGLPVPVVKEAFDVIEEALYGSVSSGRGDGARYGLRPPAAPRKRLSRSWGSFKKAAWIAAGIAALAAVTAGVTLYVSNAGAEASPSIEEILKRIARVKETVNDDNNSGNNDAADNDSDDGGSPVVFLQNYPGYGYQTADGVWHFVEGAKRADGTVYRNGRWIQETPPSTIPPVSINKPWTDVPAKDRQTLIEISREVAKHYDYHGDGVIFTEDGNVDCEDYAIAFYLLAKERGYNVKIVVSNTIVHAFNTVTINGVTYIVEPQAGEWRNGDLFEVDDIRYGGTWGNPDWRGNLYDLTDIEDNTKYYIEKYVL